MQWTFPRAAICTISRPIENIIGNFNISKKQNCPFEINLTLIDCSIDATTETGRLGRLVNHSRLQPNCCTKVVVVDKVPRLVLIAKSDIKTGTELLYDYGDRSKESLIAHPWLAE